MLKLASTDLNNWHSLVSRYFGIRKKIINHDKLILGIRIALLWGCAGVGLIGLIFGFDLVGEGIKEGLTLLFEFAQEKLETLYRVGFKLNLYHAQMATAYTGFLALLGLAFLVFKKFSGIFKEIQANLIEERQKAQELWLKHCDNITKWWGSLDGFNKFCTVIGLTVVALPFLSIVCLVLGKIVAELV